MNLFSILFPLISLVSIVNGYSYVPELNLTQYEGTWFEVYKDLFDETFQKGGTCVTATYKLLDNGTVSVFNSQISLSGKQENITGSAYYEDGNYGGDLTVYLDGTIAAPYWVIGLGPIVNGYYDYAIVSDDKQISLFVLARNIDTFFKKYNEEVLDSLSDFGFTKKYNEPIQVDQSDCEYR